MSARRVLWFALALASACANEAPPASLEDAALADVAPIDVAPIDGAPIDAAPIDAGLEDASIEGSGAIEDAGARDAELEDAVDDAGASEDASGVDAGAPDAERTDADAIDAEPIDATLADAGPPLLRPFDVEGFGRATVGGWQPGFDSYLVTSFADSGPGTLRDALDTSHDLPRVVTFASDGTIVLQNSLLVPSNLSIDARGRHVVITGKGLILAGSDEVILTNLTFRDVAGDGEDGVRIGDPTLGPSERVVLDHLTFEATGDHGDSANVDEAISVIFGSTDITFAWLRVERWEKVMLFGNGDAPAAIDANIRVTIHHMLARSTGRRHPQARYGTYDVYDCFFDDWHMYGFFALPPFRESFGVQAQDDALVVVENTSFRRNVGTWDFGSQADDATRCESGGVVEERTSQVVPGGSATLRFGTGCPAVTTPWMRPYPITLDAPDDALRMRLEAEAGATL